MKLRWLIANWIDKPILQYWDEGDDWNKPQWVNVPFVIENRE